MTLGATNGIAIVEAAPAKKVPIITIRRPIRSKRKPITIDTGIAKKKPYERLFAWIALPLLLVTSGK